VIHDEETKTNRKKPYSGKLGIIDMPFGLVDGQ